MPEKVCFVVMGFGRKTDYPTGRVLDLDKSYRTIIRPAVLAAGLACKRADEIVHSGFIDLPMYQQLLTADVVIADLSTYNCNAFYELGVRHALRPYTTITIAEEKMVFPFDVNHIAIRRYQHMGEGIDFEEVERMRADLTAAIQAIAAKPVNDSPVYQFLTDLEPPAFVGAGAVPAPVPESAADATVGALMQMVEDAMDASDFVTAKALLARVRKSMPRDAYVLQKLAVATYKAQSPSAMQALEDARSIILELEPDVSTDVDTLGVWGSIHKRFWSLTREPGRLDTAIFAYQKGFILKNDAFNGINLAFLLNVRASVTADPREALADNVVADRTRRHLVDLCNTQLAGKLDADRAYWVRAMLAEIWLGLGDRARSDAYWREAVAVDPPPAAWMIDGSRRQMAELAAVLDSASASRP
jgi:hypothetical protein